MNKLLTVLVFLTLSPIEQVTEKGKKVIQGLAASIETQQVGNDPYRSAGPIQCEWKRERPLKDLRTAAEPLLLHGEQIHLSAIWNTVPISLIDEAASTHPACPAHEYNQLRYYTEL